MHPSNAEPWASLRLGTPACTNGIYLNSAGASPTHSETHNAIVAHLALERELGGYHAAHASIEKIHSFYTHIAALINATPKEISFCENATRAWGMAFYALQLSQGDRVITHISEYSSNLMAMRHRAERDGIIIDFAPSLADGTIDCDGLEKLITPNTKLIAVSHIAMHLGLVNPAEKIGEIAEKHALTYMLDACQSIGQRVIDVAVIKCHILTATGRKFLRGPRGTGFLYVNARTLPTLQPITVDNLAASWQADGSFVLSQDHTRFESWERNVAAMLGLAKAAELAVALNLQTIQSRVCALANYAISKLSGCEGVRPYELNSENISGIITLKLQHANPFDLAEKLEQSGVRLSVVKRQQAYPYFHFIGLEQDGIIRLALHYYNTQADIDALIHKLEEINVKN